MNVGTSVAHYQILSIIGRGGMGEVYRARDNKLQREVALKTLSPEFAADADRVARLEREATVIAGLNHPNIAAIFGIEEHEGRKFLVLELVDGESLADRLSRRPLPLEQALESAAQIASALESAHERGVVHRDLKPDNVVFTGDGRAKVLDFGIAKSFAPGTGRATTVVVTEVGVAVGTAPYMSPEQARGEAADAQTDIWALGVTLYEMLTGRSPFKRNTSTETLACVLETQPDYTALPENTPATVRRLIRRCLEKDRKRRFRDMADVRIEIEDTLAGLGVAATDESKKKPARLRAVAAGAVSIALLGLAGLGVRALATRDAPPAPVVRLSISGLERAFNSPFGLQDLAISPDGAQIAYAGRDAGTISVRRLNDPQVTLLTTTISSQAGANPFFSPDGAWVGAGTLIRMPSSGGSATRIYDHTERPFGASWGADGTIVFATSTGLHQIASDGGAPELLASPSAERGEALYAWPQLLPNRRAVLFTIVQGRGSIDSAQIALLDLETRETRVLLTGGTSPRYSPTGHIVYAARQRLFAVAFDDETGTTSGKPVELRGISVATRDDNGAAQFALAENGTLAFLEPAALGPPRGLTLSWLDRDGNETALPLQPNRYNAPRVSPDGGRIAFDIAGVNRDVWIWDIARESLTRLTDGPGEELLPVWAPDGRRVYFASNRGNFDIYSQAADGSSPARLEVAYPGFQAPISVSTDGTKIISSLDFRDLAVADLTQQKLEPLLQSDAVEWLGDLSPDGRWLAFESNESGQFEVYVRPFPDVASARVQVSIAGGGFARWSPAGSDELYYVAADGAMMAVAMETRPELRAGRPTKLFQLRDGATLGAGGRQYDVASDGRFLVPRAVDEAAPTVSVTVILNWFEELRAQVPSSP